MSLRLDYAAAAPAGMKALGGVYGYISQCGLPAQLVDLVYLRTSQINGCALLHRHAFPRPAEGRADRGKAGAGVRLA
ncbi:MAG: hypothetical protein PW843_25290 [Azospirillaceae bacterium]|nr:hypothetical protein [Azospirillaceae bacterium]